MEPLILVTIFAAVLVSRTALEIWAETSADFFQQGWDDFFWSIPPGEASGAAAMKFQATLPEVEYLRELCAQTIL